MRASGHSGVMMLSLMEGHAAHDAWRAACGMHLSSAETCGAQAGTVLGCGALRRHVGQLHRCLPLPKEQAHESQQGWFWCWCCAFRCTRAVHAATCGAVVLWGRPHCGLQWGTLYFDLAGCSPPLLLFALCALGSLFAVGWSLRVAGPCFAAHFRECSLKQQPRMGTTVRCLSTWFSCIEQL